jgi:hypothetical protein
VINRCHYCPDTPTGIAVQSPLTSSPQYQSRLCPSSSRMYLSSKTDLTACMDAMSSLIGTDSHTPWLSCYLQSHHCHCLCHPEKQPSPSARCHPGADSLHHQSGAGPRFYGCPSPLAPDSTSAPACASVEIGNIMQRACQSSVGACPSTPTVLLLPSKCV